MGACGITPGTISTYGLFIDAVFGTSLNFIGGGHFNGIPRCSSGIIGGGFWVPWLIVSQEMVVDREQITYI